MAIVRASYWSRADIRVVDSVLSETALDPPTASPLRSYIRWAYLRTPGPIAYHYFCGAALIAYELARRGFRIVGEQERRPRLFVAFVSPPDSGKSAGMASLRRFAEEVRPRAARTLTTMRAPVHIDKKQAICLSITNGTGQGVSHKLMSMYLEDAQCTPVVLTHDELSSLLREKGHNWRETILQLYDGHDMPFIHRQYQKAEDAEEEEPTIRTPVASVLVASASKRLRNCVLTEEDLEGGFASRFIWLHDPEMEVKGLSAIDVLDRKRNGPMFAALLPGAQTAAVKSWDVWFRWLVAVRHKSVLIDSDVYGKALTAWGTAVANLWHGESGDRDRLTAVLSRNFDQSVILGVVLAAARCSTTPDGAIAVTLDDLLRAGEVVRYSFVTTYFAYIAREFGRRGRMELTTRVLNYLVQRGIKGATKTQLYRRCSDVHKVELEEALTTLVDSEQVIRTIRPSVTKKAHHYVAAPHMLPDETATPVLAPSSAWAADRGSSLE